MRESVPDAFFNAVRSRGEFGLIGEEARPVTKFTILDTIWQDAVYALRTMRQKPVFAATAVLTMALAIGANTAMFTVIRAVLLKPLQYHDPDRLINMSGGATPTLFADIQSGARSYTELGAFTPQENITLSGGTEPEVLKGARVSASFLRILGVEPVLGRGFRSEEDSAGGAPVAMISSELWRRRFAGDLQIAGKTATLASTAYTIIGVLPLRFQFPVSGIDVWMTAPTEWPLMSAKSRVDSPFLSVFGRLKPGISMDQASAEMKVIRHRYAIGNPELLAPEPKTEKAVTAMQDDLVADVRSMLWMLFGAVAFVLLIACANVAGLLLARAPGRSRGIRIARGAGGRPQSGLIGQLLAESVLLSLCRQDTGCLRSPARPGFCAQFR